MTKVVKKKKRKSFTAQIRELKESRDDYYNKLWKKNRELWALEKEIDDLRALLPLKYYKINFKIKSNDGYVVPVEVVTSSYSAEMAIEKVKKGKTYPDTFELLEIKCMA